MSFITFEYAARLLVALISGMFLFTLSAMCVMLWEAGGITWRWRRELESRPNWLMGRLTPEPRET